MPIIQLNSRTAKLITSSVVVTSVYSAVKELLENAVDAGATSIIISLERHGWNRIEVRDNGSGICHADVPLACLAGHTSKIKEFSDLDHLSSYGFRGQALNALCAVADVSFTTRTSDDEMAVTYTLDKEGRIVSSCPSHLGVGTTVMVKNLFMVLPVRRKMLTKSSPSLRSILWLLRCYSMAKPELALSLVHDGSCVWKKSAAHALPSAVQEALGYKLAVALHQVYWRGSCINCEETPEEDLLNEMEMDILVPKKGSTISEFCSGQTQEGIVLNEYLIINRRPMKHKKLEKLMANCIGKGLATDFSNRKKPPWVLRLYVPSDQLDVNLASDKTKVFLRCEDAVVHKLEEIIYKYYGVQHLNTDVQTQCTKDRLLVKELESPKTSLASQCSVTSEPSDSGGTSAEKPSNAVDFPDIEVVCPSSDSPPPKQRRLEADEDRPSLPDDDPLGSRDNDYFLSLEPFQVSDSQISKAESPRESDLEENENVLNPLQSCTENFSCGTFRIEVFEKPSDIRENEKAVERVSATENCMLDVDSTESLVANISREKQEAEGSEIGKGDVEVVVNTRDTLQSLENLEEHDLEAWSRGKISTSGVTIAQPVRILQPQVNHLNNDEDSSVSGLETKRQPDVAPFKLLNNEVKDGNSSSHHFSAKSKPREHEPPSNSVASPLPNACSQLGRRDMRGFDCFASKTRPEIIADQPGIMFTDVAKELAKRWEALSDEERDDFRKKGIAKAAARHKSANEQPTMTSSLPVKTSNKLPGILNEKSKQKSLIEHVVNEKQDLTSVPSGVRIINVSMTELQKKVHIRNGAIPEEEDEKGVKGEVSLVGQLRPSGMWVYRKGKEIGILRHFALQELVVHQKLMDSLTIPIRPLTIPIVFDERALGSELWKKFLSLEHHYDVIKQQNIVTSDLITKNGFQISLLQGEGDCEDQTSAIITGIASVFSPYGLEDLKEVLQISDPMKGELAKCRTLQISNFIESEATRMCRQSPPALPKDDVIALLKQWNGKNICLHSEPVFSPFTVVGEQCDILN